MKFGGTSVGKPERMHQVAQLITADQEKKIVVLSALSGTTNALVAIGDALSKGDREGAKEQIVTLEKHYQNFVNSLLKQPTCLQKGKTIVAEHFEFLEIITKINIKIADEIKKLVSTSYKVFQFVK